MPMSELGWARTYDDEYLTLFALVHYKVHGSNMLNTM
jgi:hypothetical protein